MAVTSASIGSPFDRGVDVVERGVGLEEEVAREVEVRDAAVALLEVDDDELSAGHLVFAVHGSA